MAVRNILKLDLPDLGCLSVSSRKCGIEQLVHIVALTISSESEQ
jgi:hypothetical protein